MRTKLWVLFAGVLLVAGGPRAQEVPRPPGPGEPFDRHLFPPELVMRHQNALDLDQEQKNSIREEIRRAQGRFLELQWRLQDAAETLRSLLEESRVSEQEALDQLDRVLEAEREIKRTQITLMIRIKNLLTPEQQELLQRLPRPRPAPPGPSPGH